MWKKSSIFLHHDQVGASLDWSNNLSDVRGGEGIIKNQRLRHKQTQYVKPNNPLSLYHTTDFLQKTSGQKKQTL
jgi:hypothetical protein